jgi:hypothetical protein
MEQVQKFSVILPAEFQKTDDGEWRVYGLASTPKRDLQGEVIDLKGLDLNPIQKGKGIFNWDHKEGPENTIGAIDMYKKADDGLYLGGYLFKEHDRAKAIYQIMSSLKKSDRGRVGMSVEGVIKKRAGDDGKTISKATITKCALTMNPVNTDTYADLVKSLSTGEVEFDRDMLSDGILPENSAATPKTEGKSTEVLFTASQVMDLLQKALSVGSSYATSTPAQLTGGDALAKEDLDQKKPCGDCKDEACKCPKEMKKGDAAFYKSMLSDLMSQLTYLYPEATQSEIWEAVKDRLHRKFPSLNVGQ